MVKVKGEIILQINDNTSVFSEKNVLDIEIWMNEEVNRLAYEKFKVSVRVHLSGS